jgi:hypothetical protein
MVKYSLFRTLRVGATPNNAEVVRHTNTRPSYQTHCNGCMHDQTSRIVLEVANCEVEINIVLEVHHRTALTCQGMFGLIKGSEERHNRASKLFETSIL